MASPVSGLALQNWLGPLPRHSLLVAGMCGTGLHQNGDADRAFACGEEGIRNASMFLRLFSSVFPGPFQNQSSRVDHDCRAAIVRCHRQGLERRMSAPGPGL